MTVAADLLVAHGIHRRLFLRIEGVEEELWQDDGTGSKPSGWTRTGYCCLLPPQEMTQEFDFREMKAGLSAMTFEILDIHDTDGTSRFSKIFSAPARWEDSAHYRIQPDLYHSNVVKANDSNIPVQYATPTSTSGTVYIHRERIGYANIEAGVGGYSDSAVLTHCNRGMYPAVGAQIGHTISRPLYLSDEEMLPAVGTVPFTALGSRVALYLLTKDPSTGAWHTSGSEVLVWSGTISESIKYVPSQGVWQLTAESVLQELEKTVCNTFKTITPLEPSLNSLLAPPNTTTINLSGDDLQSRRFVAMFVLPDGTVSMYNATVPKGVYSTEGLIYVLNDPYSWQLTSGTQLYTLGFGLRVYRSAHRNVEIVFSFGAQADYDGTTVTLVANNCHALNALGFGLAGAWGATLTFDWNSAGEYKATITAPDPPCNYYQPLHPSANGLVMPLHRLVEEHGGLVDSQEPGYGLVPATGAYIMLNDAKVDGYADVKGKVFFHYTASELASADYGNTAYTKLTLAYDVPNQEFGKGGYCKVVAGGEQPTMQQVWMARPGKGRGPTVHDAGPYEQLLPFLVSTGSPGANSTYDFLPHGWGLGIPSALVDMDSFLAADASVKGMPDLAVRSFYPITEPTPLSELLSAENKLFHKAVSFKNGKVTVVDVGRPNPDAWTVELSESNRYDRRDLPDVEMNQSVVVNQVKLVTHRWFTDKDNPPITVSDADSIEMLGKPVAVEIEHKGLPQQLTAEQIAEAVRQIFLARPVYMRREMPFVEVSLAPSLVNRVNVGDVVLYSSSHTPDPWGSGSYSTSCPALVARVGWDYSTWKGTAQLILIPTAASTKPWAPAALVDMVIGGNGYSPPYLYLADHYFGEGDTDDLDGNRFQQGHVIVVRDTCPANANTLVQWGPMELASSFDNTALRLTLPSALTGYNASKEYYVTFANWAACPVNQQNVGSWQAYVGTQKFGDANTAQRWG